MNLLHYHSSSSFNSFSTSSIWSLFSYQQYVMTITKKIRLTSKNGLILNCSMSVKTINDIAFANVPIAPAVPIATDLMLTGKNSFMFITIIENWKGKRNLVSIKAPIWKNTSLQPSQWEGTWTNKVTSENTTQRGIVMSPGSFLGTNGERIIRKGKEQREDMLIRDWFKVGLKPILPIIIEWENSIRFISVLKRRKAMADLRKESYLNRSKGFVDYFIFYIFLYSSKNSSTSS